MSHWYVWNRDTDEITAFKHDILTEPQEWWVNEYKDQLGKSRHAGSTVIRDIWISTVFLAIDYNFLGGRPVLFETMIFDILGKKRRYDYYQERYHTPAEARIGHDKIVSIARRLLCRAPQISYDSFEKILRKL